MFGVLEIDGGRFWGGCLMLGTGWDGRDEMNEIPILNYFDDW